VNENIVFCCKRHYPKEKVFLPKNEMWAGCLDFNEKESAIVLPAGGKATKQPLSQPNKKYPSCPVSIGEFCNKHGVTHTKKQKAKENV
jgi:hypothetical protein